MTKMIHECDMCGATCETGFTEPTKGWHRIGLRIDFEFQANDYLLCNACSGPVENFRERHRAWKDRENSGYMSMGSGGPVPNYPDAPLLKNRKNIFKWLISKLSDWNPL